MAKTQIKVYLFSVARHVLTAAGVYVGAKYGLNGEEIDAVVGGLMVAIGMGWSFAEKKK
jgi:hypothetical protein